MNMEKKFGVYVTKLNKLKEFQLSLLKKSGKLKPVLMNIIGKITMFIVMDQSRRGPFIARLSVGKGVMLLEREGGGEHKFLLKEISVVSVIGNETKIQFTPESFFDQCILHFNDNQQLQNFKMLLPVIARPNIDNDQFNTSNSSEESDFNDSGSGRTQRISTSSRGSGSDSDNQTEDEGRGKTLH